jgi:crossover junction endodeoxyribonuclease RuvC
MIVLGIDPGKSGGWALVNNGDLIGFGLMPTVDVPKGRGKAKILSPHLLVQALSFGPFAPDHAYIEEVHSMPKQGVASSFDFGKSFGIAIGVVAAMGYPTTFIRPQQWRKVSGIKATGDVKAGSQARALDLWPVSAAVFEKKKNEGIWEAALIARAGYLLETGNA